MSKEEQTAAFLRDILDNRFPTEEQLRERQEQIGFVCGSSVRTIIIKVCRTKPSPIISLYDLSKQFAGMIRGTFGFLYKNAVILLHESDDPGEDIAQLLAPLEPYLTQYHMAAGISNSFHTLWYLRNAGYQSNIALQLGSELSEDRLLLYRDYAMYHMIGLALRTEPIENFIQPDLTALLEFCERTQDTTLLETLRVYLDCGCSRPLAVRRPKVCLLNQSPRSTAAS